MENLKILNLDIPKNKRIIAISDIHGEVYLFRALLEKVNFSDDDILILLGDIYLKGSYPKETLDFTVDLCKKSNVYALKGNCDFMDETEDSYQEDHKVFLDSLPHIIETDEITFVHAGLERKHLADQDVLYCLTIRNFLEIAEPFEKWAMVGHYPVANYCYEMPSYQPIINDHKKIISIDGGCVIGNDGQLNAFIIENGEFSYEFVENFQKTIVEQDIEGAKGDLNICFNDRFIEILENGEEFSLVRHIKTGKELCVPTQIIWYYDGKACATNLATNHFLSLKKGDEISIVKAFSDRVFAKSKGIGGWILKNALHER